MSRHDTAPKPPPKSQSKKQHSVPPLLKPYLVAYNILSALGWAYVLGLTLTHLFNLDGNAVQTHSKAATSVLSRFMSSLPKVLRSSATTLDSRLPSFLQPIYHRSSSTYLRVGTQTAIVQTFAVLEVVHVLLGWVRSPLQTTAMQVSSRLFLVWGIAEQFPAARSNPLYTSMVLAWSVTEIIRYSFYACNLLGKNPYVLLYLRYTTFYILYPLGASSEAFLTYATLPASWPLPGWRFPGAWRPTDYARAVLFCICWPGLYVMYTYMIAQRRKVIGKAPKTLKTS
ncbi:hypothetical protein M413DRAFT_333798 [Hebeloma cylindrosporum]|uniref:Very-long-chain (3R)-3-hydroxyacyl-CoA dehydratase n=1 Tax=Hebeloma cylindrosporum TaxID=76867 RepID=A0A0C3CN47_HEBCY|nr:hypothetical protein M413DRAFT_333798 [Hebeloma cylindrosporum h7]